MITFISLYGGGRSVVVDGDRDIRRRHSTRVIIIQIISLAVFVFLGGQSLLSKISTKVKSTIECKHKVLLNASVKINRTLSKISTKVKSTIKCKCKVKYTAQ
jgi:hypothetical protein